VEDIPGEGPKCFKQLWGLSRVRSEQKRGKKEVRGVISGSSWWKKSSVQGSHVGTTRSGTSSPIAFLLVGGWEKEVGGGLCSVPSDLSTDGCTRHVGGGVIAVRKFGVKGERRQM